MRINKPNWLYEVSPEKYQTKPTRYIIRKLEYGLWNKQEAEIICEFLRAVMPKMLDDIAEDETNKLTH